MDDTHKLAKHVLVVEDEPDHAELLAAILRSGGYRVTVAHDGERARAAVAQERPDLITLDIEMPQKNGIRFFRELRSTVSFRDLPVVVVTGLTSDDRDMETFIHALLDVAGLSVPAAYLEKPVDADELLSTVSDAIAA